MNASNIMNNEQICVSGGISRKNINQNMQNMSGKKRAQGLHDNHRDKRQLRRLM